MNYVGVKRNPADNKNRLLKRRCIAAVLLSLHKLLPTKLHSQTNSFINERYNVIILSALHSVMSIVLQKTQTHPLNKDGLRIVLS